LKRDMKVDVVVGKPKVAYKETITTKSEAQGKHVKQTGGRGQYGDAWIRIEPYQPVEGDDSEDTILVLDEIKGGSIPTKFIPPIEKGIVETMERGVLAGYHMMDIRAVVFDGSYHDVDSSEMAFKIAGSMAFKDAAKRASPVLLEPIMQVEVVTPEEYMGAVHGDLAARRGRIVSMEARGSSQVIRANVPLATMFGYATDLRSATQGRATYTMQFARYEEVPTSLAEEIMAKVAGRAPARAGSR